MPQISQGFEPTLRLTNWRARGLQRSPTPFTEPTGSDPGAGWSGSQNEQARRGVVPVPRYNLGVLYGRSGNSI